MPPATLLMKAEKAGATHASDPWNIRQTRMQPFNAILDYGALGVSPDIGTPTRNGTRVSSWVWGWGGVGGEGASSSESSRPWWEDELGNKCSLRGCE